MQFYEIKSTAGDDIKSPLADSCAAAQLPLDVITYVIKNAEGKHVVFLPLP